MNLQSKFSDFNSAIALSQKSTEYAKLKEKDASIISDIKKDLVKEGYNVIEDFRQGSFATHTAIRSLDGDYDLDRGIVIDKSTTKDTPVPIKVCVRDVLEKRGFKNASIKIPCVTADYSSLNLHIDYPVYRVDVLGNYELGVGKENSRTENQKWQPGDPKGLINWVNKENDFLYTGDQVVQYRRLIRYIKRWRDVNFTQDIKPKIYSIGLTIMVIREYQPYSNPPINNDLQVMIDVVDRILNGSYFNSRGGDKYDVEVINPVLPFRDIFSKHGTTVGTTLRNKLENLKTQLEKAQSSDTEKEACEILREVFGNDFPEGSDDTSRVAKHARAGYVPNHGGA